MRLHGNCPYCLKEDEDLEHVMKCTHQAAKENSRKAILQLVKQLLKIGTCRRAVLAIKQEVMAWRRGHENLCVDCLPENLRKVILAQRKIGWKAFLDGLFVKDWEVYFFQRTKATRT